MIRVISLNVFVDKPPSTLLVHWL